MKKRYIKSDSIPDIVNSTPPHIFVGTELEIAANTWVRVETSVGNARSPSLLASHPEVIESTLGIWHYSQDYNEIGEITRSAIGETGSLEEPTLSIASLGGSGYLTFFPPDGVTVWVKSRSLLEFDTDENLVKTEDGRSMVPPPVPDGTEPFRFIGSSSNLKPYIVGPFLRTQSVWVRATADIKVSWASLQGSNFSSVVRFGE